MDTDWAGKTRIALIITNQKVFHREGFGLTSQPRYLEGSSRARTNSGKYLTETAPGSSTAS